MMLPLTKSQSLLIIHPKRKYNMKKLSLVLLTLYTTSSMAVETTDLEKAVRFGQVVDNAKSTHDYAQACVAQTGLIEALKNADMVDVLTIAKKEQAKLCKVFNKRV